jgi:predicted CoA-binding protein
MKGSEQYTNPSEDQIRVVLRKCKKVAVVGLSSDESKPSLAVARLLQQRGFTIYPVNPKEKKILGRKAYPDLKSIPQPVEIVDIFRKPEHVPAVVDQAIQIGAKVVWMQEGVVNHPAAMKAVTNGIIAIMDRCMAKDCRKFCD